MTDEPIDLDDPKPRGKLGAANKRIAELEAEVLRLSGGQTATVSVAPARTGPLRFADFVGITLASVLNASPHLVNVDPNARWHTGLFSTLHALYHSYILMVGVVEEEGGWCPDVGLLDYKVRKRLGLEIPRPQMERFEPDELRRKELAASEGERAKAKRQLDEETRKRYEAAGIPLQNVGA